MSEAEVRKLDVRRLTRSFGGVRAVDEATLHCCEGEVLAIIGPNGAGKTTLFSLLSGFLRPDAGEIVFDGRRVDGLNAETVCRRGLARTFQVTRPFFGLSVLENVLAGSYLRHASRRRAEERAHEVLERFGLGPRRYSLARDLNIADRKRLELARAYATEPSLMLLDEVGAGLTPVDLRALSELIRELNREQSVSIIFVEHVMALVTDLADRVVVLHHGRVLADGPVDHVMTDEAVVEAYLGEQGAHARA